MSRSRAFSLIELVAVLVVLAVLAGVAVPRYLSMSDRAKTAADEAALAGMNTALKNAYTAHRVADAPQDMWVVTPDDVAPIMETAAIPEGWSIDSSIFTDQRGNQYILDPETQETAATIRLASDDDLAALNGGGGGGPGGPISLLFASPPSDPDPQPLATIRSAEEIQALTAAEIPGANLTPEEFAFLTPGQLSQLTPEQLAAFSAEHIAALSATQIAALSNAQFQAVVAGITISQIAYASPEQVAMLSSDAYALISLEIRGAMTPQQIAERAISEAARQLNFDGMRSLAVTAIKYLLPTQIALITSDYAMSLISSDRRAAFTSDQVQALDSARVSIAYLTDAQRLQLTTGQMAAIRADDVRYAPVARLGDIPPATIALINSDYAMSLVSSDRRAAFSAAQVQAIDSSRVSLAYLTADQRTQLTTGQMAAIRPDDVRYAPVARLGDIPPATIAQINSDYAMSLVSSDRRAAFSAAQVQAIDSSRVSLAYLTADQRTQLTTGQMASIRADDVRHAPVDRLGDVPPATIAQINSDYAMSLVSSDRRAAFTTAQVQAIDSSRVSLAYLTTDQRTQLTTTQMASIRADDVRHAPVDRLGDVPPATIAQINSDYAMSLVSSDRRAALSAAQVQALDASRVSLAYLTANQRTQLTTTQMASIRADDVRHADPTRIAEIPTATINQINSAYAWSLVPTSNVQALTQAQILAMSADSFATISSRLTADQRAWR